MIKVSFSHFAIVISFIVIAFIILSTKYWREENKIIESDVISYYAYLPSIFIYQDASLSYLDKANPTVQSKIWFQTSQNGGRVIKTTMGVAFFYFPFFVLAHHYAIASDYLSNGFSLPYKLAIVMSSFFYFLMGLIFLRKFLLNYFDEQSSFWTILIVGIGTNLVNYVTREPGMSHVYSFFLFSVFLYYTDIWHRFRKSKSLLILGFLGGLIVLVRPINLLVILVFILYNAQSLSHVKNKLNMYYQEKFSLLKAIGVAILVILPQLIYWKYNTGDWLYFSYSDNENFFFSDPKLIEGLFGYRKGWLLYTPLMALSICGLMLPNKQLNKFRLGISLFLLLQLYLIFSWWSWWYGGSFGSRPMIDVYPLLAVPIAAFLQFAFKSRVWIRRLILSLVVFLIGLNLFQNYQYRIGVIHYEAMTKETYWMVWGETKYPLGYWDKLEVPDYEAAKKGDR